MSREFSPLGPGEELTDAESFQRIHTEVPQPEPAWRPVPLAERSASRSASWVPLRAPHPPATPPERMRNRGLTRQDVERVAVRRARAHAEAVALFLTRRGGIELACCDPEPPRLPGPIYWTEQRFALVSVLEGRRPYCGAPGRDPLAIHILRCLGREGVREIALIPICVQERLVAILYADAGSEPFAEGSVAELSSICDGVAGTFEFLILERRRYEAR